LTWRMFFFTMSYMRSTCTPPPLPSILFSMAMFVVFVVLSMASIKPLVLCIVRNNG
jgi:hypothetical protein